jgi:hypothetical protein
MTGSNIASLFQSKRGNPRGNPNNPGFVAHLKQQSDNHVVVRGLVLELLLGVEQPLTAREVRELAVQNGLGDGYKTFDNSLVRALLGELIESGHVVTRVETVEERGLRAGGQRASGLPAAIYSARLPGVHTPPARTERVVVPGVYLATLEERKPRKPKSKRRGRPPGSKNRPKPSHDTAVPLPVFNVHSGPLSSPSGPVSSIELLVEQIVQERTAELTARLAKAERKLAEALRILA